MWPALVHEICEESRPCSLCVSAYYAPYRTVWQAEAYAPPDLRLRIDVVFEICTARVKQRLQKCVQVFHNDQITPKTVFALASFVMDVDDCVSAGETALLS